MAADMRTVANASSQVLNFFGIISIFLFGDYFVTGLTTAFARIGLWSFADEQKSSIVDDDPLTEKGVFHLISVSVDYVTIFLQAF